MSLAFSFDNFSKFISTCFSELKLMCQIIMLEWSIFKCPLLTFTTSTFNEALLGFVECSPVFEPSFICKFGMLVSNTPPPPECHILYQQFFPHLIFAQPNIFFHHSHALPSMNPCFLAQPVVVSSLTRKCHPWELRNSSLSVPRPRFSQHTWQDLIQEDEDQH